MGRPPDALGDLFQLAATSYPTLHEVTGEQFLLKSREEESVAGSTGHRFWVLDARGEVLAELAPEFESDCEHGLPVVYEMRDGTLFRYSGRSNDAYTHSLCQWQAQVVCAAWRRLDREDPNAQRVLKALAGHRLR